jgi:molecular chaperone GrpE (heat shock protein)
MLSITQEIDQLLALDLPEFEADDGAPEPPDMRRQWESVARSVSRLGKQQLQANQRAELLTEELGRALEEARERGDEHRRENARLHDESRRRARALLEIPDTLDDLAALVRGRGDAVWLEHLERLTAKTLAVLARAGLAPVDASGSFHEDEHEAVETVDAAPGQEPAEIVEVVRRGFRLDGQLLRRAQVVTTR